MNFFKEEKHPTDGHFKVVSSITHVKLAYTVDQRSNYMFCAA